MLLHPTSSQDLTESLADANARGAKIESVDLRAMNRVLAHTPEDMTVTVEAGITLAVLQQHLAAAGQWLPIDPPHPDKLTLADLIHNDLSGPRRYGYGTIRHWLIGIRFALADGTLVYSGGKVVKNVAGYDLAKLIIGSRGTLGVTIEATFKLRPLPEEEQFVETACESLEAADRIIGAILDSDLTPVVLDLHNHPSPLTPHCSLVLGFAGTREEVNWQLQESLKLGFNRPSSLDYETKFRAGAAPVQKLSVLPSKTVAAVGGLNGAPFVARAGNGVIYYRGSTVAQEVEMPSGLMRRLKDALDSRHTLPE